MVTRAAIEKRLAAIEAKTKPKRIETLADWVMWVAHAQPGEPRPPMDPDLEEVLYNFTENCSNCHEV